MRLPKNADAQTVGDLIGVSARRVQQLAREGVVPKAGRGKYPLAGCVQAYIAYWQRQAEEALSRGPANFKEARAKKVRAEAELKELELGLKRGDLVPVDVVEAQVRDALEPVNVGLRTAHTRLSRSWSERLGIPEGEAVYMIRELSDDIRAHLVQMMERDEELPEDLPWRSLLEAEGITTLAALRELDDLTAVAGIGPARARRIKEAIG